MIDVEHDITLRLNLIVQSVDLSSNLWKHVIPQIKW